MNVAAISLGCDKNRVDTENLLGFVIEAGHNVVNEYEEADAIIVNTCAFLQAAVKESIDTILSVRAIPTIKYVIMCGCLPMRYVKELTSTDFPEVNAMLPNTAYHRIGEVLCRLQKGETGIILDGDESMPIPSLRRTISTPSHYAYLKIAEGCNNKCTYCAIPSIRGKYRSEKISNLVIEAKSLISQGVKELILVAQDVTRFGQDNGENLISLLDELCKTPIEKIRLLYCYPDKVTDELLNFIDSEPKMAKYIDIPLQHVSSRVLRRMNRPERSDDVKSLIQRIRHCKSNIVIRSTFMVGFPGESELDFSELCDFLREYQLDYVGFFAYSREENTPAYKLDNQVKEKVKKERLSIVTAIQSEIMVMNANRMVGKVLDVIYDGIDYDKELFFGHTDGTCPDVDPKIYFKSAFPVQIGDTYQVKIEEVKKIDLYGITMED